MQRLLDRPAKHTNFSAATPDTSISTAEILALRLLSCEVGRRRRPPAILHTAENDSGQSARLVVGRENSQPVGRLQLQLAAACARILLVYYTYIHTETDSLLHMIGIIICCNQ